MLRLPQRRNSPQQTPGRQVNGQPTAGACKALHPSPQAREQLAPERCGDESTYETPCSVWTADSETGVKRVKGNLLFDGVKPTLRQRQGGHRTNGGCRRGGFSAEPTGSRTPCRCPCGARRRRAAQPGRVPRQVHGDHGGCGVLQMVSSSARPHRAVPSGFLNECQTSPRVGIHAEDTYVNFAYN